MKKLLVTGAFGFFGSHIIKHFKDKGFYVAGIGTCKEENNDTKILLDSYIISEITMDALNELTDEYDAIIHCAGGSSVGASMAKPIKDLLRTTLSTEIILEYIRLTCPKTKLIYISSAAVYGDKHTSPIEEEAMINPMSFYGIHKHLSEELCAFYNNRFNIKISIVRFFSIYGPGLQKQLLWDACNKISSDAKTLMFFGTGEELRDWIYITDALKFVQLAFDSVENFLVLNAATGQEISVREVLSSLVKNFTKKQTISFNKEVKIGDPTYLYANTEKATSLGLKIEVDIEEGLKKYVQWYKNVK